MNHMATIQQIQALEERITEVVQEYIDSADCYENPWLQIKRQNGELTMDIIQNGSKIDTCDLETYPMADLVCTEQDGTPSEPNYDEINEVANSWIFLD